MSHAHRRGAVLAVLVAVATLAGAAAAEHGTPGTTQPISRPTGTGPAAPGLASTSFVAWPDGISANGRFVGFISWSPGISNENDDNYRNAYVRDMQTGATTLVSRASGLSGAPAHGETYAMSISADGSHAAFVTPAGLDPADTDGQTDAYVRNLTAGTTTIIDPTGDVDSPPVLSADGTKVAFVTLDALVAADTNNTFDVYVVNTTTNTTTLVSRADGASGAIGNHGSFGPSISDDGTKVAFASTATNFDPAVTTLTYNVYVRDVAANTTTLVSKNAAGTVGNSDSRFPSISGDGTKIAFSSRATNFDPADTNTRDDIYVRDLAAGTTTLASRNDAGTVGDSLSDQPSLNGDGSKVAFVTASTNLSAADTNGKTDVYVRDLSVNQTALASRAPGSSGAVGDDYSTNPSIDGAGTKVAFMTAARNLSETGGDFTQAYLRDLSANTNALVSRPSGFDPFLADVNYSSPGKPNAVSADGRFVAFESQSDGLSSADDNRYLNVFVRDTLTDTTILVSRADGAAGAAANAGSSSEAISADGTKVAFVSDASNLVAGDANGKRDVFVRDLAAGTTKLVSVGTTSGADSPALSADGSKIAFVTSDSLVPADANNAEDVYLRDTSANTTTLVSRIDGVSGAAGDDSSDSPSLSGDGTLVAFASYATNLVSGDTNDTQDVFVRDLTAGTTRLVSRADGAAGAIGNYLSFGPSISGDGTKIAFSSAATNLDPADTNIRYDIFVRDLAANTTKLVSRAGGPTGAVGDSGSQNASISSDGSRVAFESRATNLVADDTNGTSDVFVRDLGADTTTLVSRAADGGPADSYSIFPSISGNGDCVTFASAAANLTPKAPPPISVTRVFMRTLARECPVSLPETTIDSGPSGVSNNRTPSFTFSSSESGSVFQCQLDGGAFGACSSPYTTASLADGGHTFAVRAIDPEGYVDPTPAARSWTVDTVSPDTAIAAGPSGTVASKSASFEFTSSEAGSSFSCSLDGGAFAACSSPQAYAGLADGAHSFAVRATDAAGNTDASPATRSWTVDTTGPQLTVTVPRQRLGTVLKRGLRANVTCSEACTLAVRLLRGATTIGSASATLGSAETKTIVVKLTAKAKKALKKAKTAKLKLRTSARDSLGNASAPVVRNVALRR